MARFVDITGRKFGQLTVESFAGSVIRSGKYRTMWRCLCDCGNRTTIYNAKLHKSCGCVSRKRLELGRKGTHYASESREYKIWSAIKTRCYSGRSRYYHRYGGRGITMCEEWENSFEAFYRDMGPRPSPKHSIERVNNSLGYGPENCVWATQIQQCRNMSTNRWLTFEGKTMCLKDWAIHAGLAPQTLWKRLKRGWSVSAAITTPLM